MRQPSGQERKRAMSRFTDQEVIEIRDRAARYERSVRDEAEAFGVAPETIRKIIRRETFTHLGGGGWRPPAPRLAPHVEATIDQEVEESQERLMKRLAADIRRVPKADDMLGELAQEPTESAAEKIRRLSGEGPPAGPPVGPLDGD